jgi:hypothetical protein
MRARLLIWLGLAAVLSACAAPVPEPVLGGQVLAEPVVEAEALDRQKDCGDGIGGTGCTLE